MRGAEIQEMDTETSVIWFLKKIDQDRHGAMVLHLINDRAAGQVFPATANVAYIIAKNWKRTSARVADSRGIIANGAVSMLADDMSAFAFFPSLVSPNRKPPTPGRDRALKPWGLVTEAEKKIREARESAGTCYKCGETGNRVRQCPHQALATIEIEAI
jgi:hypothetical protein